MVTSPSFMKVNPVENPVIDAVHSLAVDVEKSVEIGDYDDLFEVIRTSQHDHIQIKASLKSLEAHVL